MNSFNVIGKSAAFFSKAAAFGKKVAKVAALCTVTATLGCATSTMPVSAYVDMLPSSNPTPKLHITGKYLQDPNGHNVTLHGWYQPFATYFNGGGNNFANPTDYTNTSNIAPALNFMNNVTDILSNQYPMYGRYHGWYGTFVRVNGAGNSDFIAGWDANTGTLTNTAQFNGWINNFLVPYVNHCRQRGVYVVIMGNPSEQYPNGNHDSNMTSQYQQNLIQFWKAVASNPSIRSADNVQFEICNEPINIETSFGANNWSSSDDAHFAALTKFMQPIVDAIRQQNADNVIWIPGLGYQSQYAGFVAHPLIGGNIGYAAHFYPGYGNVHDDANAVRNLWNAQYKPCADNFPMMITEMWWDYYTQQQLTDNPYINLFRGVTGDVNSGFGTAAHNVIDQQGNVSYLVGIPSDLLANMQNGLNNTYLSGSQGSSAFFDWETVYGANGSAPSTPTTPVGPAAGVYEISPADDSKICVDVYGVNSNNGTIIDQYFWYGGSGQKFYFHPLGNNRYWIEPQNAPGKALDVYQINPNDNATVDIWDNYGQINEIWLVINLGNGHYRLAPDLNPTETLDQPSGSTAPDAPGAPNTGLKLQTWHWWGGIPQQWNLTPR